mmetsp:Transcript_55723/g.155299  ORF Transcript_55723/g.155299 Transcript_55723/m.155299 type:complete len:493 (-) Transcript_55723:184-1662(-)
MSLADAAGVPPRAAMGRPDQTWPGVGVEPKRSLPPSSPPASSSAMVFGHIAGECQPECTSGTSVVQRVDDDQEQSPVSRDPPCDRQHVAAEALVGSLSAEVLIGSARSGVGTAAAAPPAMPRPSLVAVPAAAPPRSPVSCHLSVTPGTTGSSSSPSMTTPRRGASGSPQIPAASPELHTAQGELVDENDRIAASGQPCSGVTIGPPPKAAMPGVVSSPPPPPAAQATNVLQRAASTPGRRVPASFASTGLFRETPSPHRERGSPIRVPALQPRSLFASPSPPRYTAGSELEPSDWASPIRRSLFSATASAASATTDAVGPVQVSARICGPEIEKEEGGCAAAPPVTPPQAVRWCLPSTGTPVRGSGGNGVPAGGKPKPWPNTPSPARTAPSPSLSSLLPSPSPSRRGVPVVAAHHLARSPSLPLPVADVSLRGDGSRARSSPDHDFGTEFGMGFGDTPRNHTDWRKSLQMARRHDDRSRPPSRPQRSRAPWR